MISISKVKLEDLPQAKELLSHTWKATYGSYYSDEQIEKVKKEWHNLENLTAQAKDPRTYFAVAKDDNHKIIGLITVLKIDDLTAFMGRIYIHPDYQSKGIGSELLNSAFEHFSTVEKFRVECEKRNNKACTFYLKRGFKIVEEKGNDVIFEKIIK